MGLDLYAKVESLLGFDEISSGLHKLYVQKIIYLESKKVLDIGCGNGNFLLILDTLGIDYMGIDLSEQMVQKAKNKKLKNIYHKNLSEVDENFDVVVAIGDVLNYLNKEELKSFLIEVENRLESGGHFIADINTKHGFRDVADGTLIREFEDKFVSVDANFENYKLNTKFTLFEKQENGFYSKESGEIEQYFYNLNEIKKMTNLKFIQKDELLLYSDEPDKNILIFQKR